MAQIIVDAGPLYAIFDHRDSSHEWAVEKAKELPAPMITCDAVVTEVCFLLSDFPLAIRKLADLIKREKIILHFNSQDRIDHIFDLMRTYRNVPMSFADACLVCMIEDNPGASLFTLDRDFEVYRQHRRRLIPLIAPFSP